jgi:hypothetical protein
MFAIKEYNPEKAKLQGVLHCFKQKYSKLTEEEIFLFRNYALSTEQNL